MVDAVCFGYLRRVYFYWIYPCRFRAPEIPRTGILPFCAQTGDHRDPEILHLYLWRCDCSNSDTLQSDIRRARDTMPARAFRAGLSVQSVERVASRHTFFTRFRNDRYESLHRGCSEQWHRLCTPAISFTLHLYEPADLSIRDGKVSLPRRIAYASSLTRRDHYG